MKHAFTAAVYAVYEFINCHPGNTELRSKLCRDLCEAENKIRSNGQSFEALAAPSYFQSYFPFNNNIWDKILATLPAMRKPSSDPRAEKELKEAQQKILKELPAKSAEMGKIASDVDKRTRRTLFLAVAPEDRPGKYNYEKLWEGTN